MAGYLPIKAGAEIKVTKDDSKITNVTDHKNFARLTNKIESFGILRKKTFAIICDGEGNMKFVELGTKTAQYQELVSRLQILKGAYDNRSIDQKDFEDLRKKIIDEMKHI
jgi:hypothetical protein